MTKDQLKHIGRHFRSAPQNNIGEYILKHEVETGVSLLEQAVTDN